MNPLISSIINSLGGNILGGIDSALGRFFPSKEKAQEFKAAMEQELLRQEGEITKAALDVQQGQIDVNKVEAASASLFVAGWRPFIGWVCGVALSWQFVVAPLLTYAIGVYASFSGINLPPLPVLDSAQLYPVLMGMLGLGGMRTFEKIKGVDRSSLNDPISLK